LRLPGRRPVLGDLRSSAGRARALGGGRNSRVPQGTRAGRHPTPADLDDFDSWVLRTVLNSQVPLFREARYLLAEETEIRDPALYHATLGAIAAGRNTRGGIADHIGRKSTDIGHPLSVLEDAQLIAHEADPF